MTAPSPCSARRFLGWLGVLTLAAWPTLEPAAHAANDPVRLSVEPATTLLDGQRATAQLIVTGIADDGSVRDLTHEAEWTIANPGVVAVEPGGHVLPLSNGTGEVKARWGTLEARAKVQVQNAETAHIVQFEHEVLPALSKAGCNQGACHGTPTGKDGFRLSLFGFDPKLDFMTLAREAGNRRVNRLEPEASLILKKGTGAIDHQGGMRFTPTSLTYRLLRDWIAEGTPAQPTGSPALVGLDVTPSVRVLDDPAQSQQIVVLGRFADGSTRDVTRLARYTSSDESIARVDSWGRARKVKR
ncbi:MAG: hypothetical protein ABI353_16225, partial [Isosphaeraceae bacterium]